MSLKKSVFYRCKITKFFIQTILLKNKMGCLQNTNNPFLLTGDHVESLLPEIVICF